MSNLQNEVMLEAAADNCPICLGDGEVRVDPAAPEEEAHMEVCVCQKKA